MTQDNQSVGVTQKAVVVRSDGKFLVLRRSKTAPSNPLKWDLPGGVLEYRENPVFGIEREIKEEAGLTVAHMKPFDVFGHENPVGFWITIAYMCKFTSGEVTLSYEHDDFKWVTKEEFKKLESSEKITQFVNNFSI